MGVRSWTWNVSGASNYTFLGEEVISSTQRVAHFSVGGPGDTITIECNVGALPQLGCSSGRSHSGNHGGASASCTFKLWDMQLTCDAEPDTDGHPWYKSTFADNIQITSNLIGASAITPQGNYHSYDWKSHLMGDEDPLATQLDTATWGGERWSAGR